MKNNNNIQSKVAALEQAVIERRRLLCRDFLKFRKQYFQGYHGFSDAAFHHEIAGLLQEITKQRGARVAIAAPRESAKSTIVTLQWVIYCICYKLEKFIVIASNTKEQAMNYLSNIKVEFLTNAELRRDFPEVLVEEKPKRSRLAQEEIITSTGIRIMVRGSGQSPRGFRNKADRPTLIILDDIEGSELSVESLYKLEDWVTKDLFKSGSPLVNVVCVGTIHHYASLLAKFTDPHQYHGWQQKVYRSVISWADNQKLWEQWKRIFRRLEEYEGADGEESARKFFEANKEEMLKGTQVLWPESKGYYALMVMIEKEGEISFNSEMQNNPVNERDAHFTVGEYQYWDDHYADAEGLIRSLKNSSYVSIVGACDPSMGKARGDRSAIITLLKDHGDDRMYVIDADITRRKPNKILEDIVEYHRHRRYMRFAFETNQAQEAMAAELERQSMDAGIPLSVIPIQHNKISKISRIQALQVPLKLGRLVLCRKHLNLLEEMKCFPKGQHEDGLDALEMAVQIADDYQGGTVGPVGPIYPTSSSSYLVDDISYHPESFDLGGRVRARDDLRYEREGRMD